MFLPILSLSVIEVMYPVIVIGFGIVFLILLFGLGSLFGYTVLRPLIKAAHGRKASPRLYTSDFFSLTMVLVLPTMLLTSFRSSNMPILLAIVVGIIVYVITIWIWARGAIKLSAIGVDNSLKRFVFLGLHLPLAILGTSMGIPMLLVGMSTTISQPQQSDYFLMFLSGLLAAIPVALLGNKICQWVVSLDYPLDPTQAIDERLEKDPLE